MNDTPNPNTPDDEPVQALSAFTEQTEPDVHLDPDTPAFDRVQTGKADEQEINAENEREYNRRYVREHGDHHGHTPPDED